MRKSKRKKMFYGMFGIVLVAMAIFLIGSVFSITTFPQNSKIFNIGDIDTGFLGESASYSGYAYLPENVNRLHGIRYSFCLQQTLNSCDQNTPRIKFYMNGMLVREWNCLNSPEYATGEAWNFCNYNSFNVFVNSDINTNKIDYSFVTTQGTGGLKQRVYLADVELYYDYIEPGETTTTTTTILTTTTRPGQPATTTTLPTTTTTTMPSGGSDITPMLFIGIILIILFLSLLVILWKWYR